SARTSPLGWKNSDRRSERRSNQRRNQSSQRRVCGHKIKGRLSITPVARPTMRALTVFLLLVAGSGAQAAGKTKGARRVPATRSAPPERQPRSETKADPATAVQD